jgi:hypothetical protein
VSNDSGLGLVPHTSDCVLLLLALGAFRVKSWAGKYVALRNEGYMEVNADAEGTLIPGL